LTVDQASEEIIESLLETNNLEKFKNTKRDERVKYHMRLGRGIRNNFGLWHGNLPLLLRTGKLHPDNASQVIK